MLFKELMIRCEAKVLLNNLLRGQKMGKFLLGDGSFFQFLKSPLSLLILSTTVFKKFSVYLLFGFILLNIKNSYSFSVDTLIGIGYSKITGDILNSSIIARKRAISNAVSKSKTKISYAQHLHRNLRTEFLNETIIEEFQNEINGYKELKNVTLDNGYIKSVVEVYVFNKNKIEFEKQKKKLLDRFLLSKQLSLKRKIDELLKIYSILEKNEFEDENLNSKIIISEISNSLSSIKIQKIDNTYKFYIEDESLEKLSWKKIETDDGQNSSSVFYIMLDLGFINYQLLKLGFNIPFIEVHV